MKQQGHYNGMTCLDYSPDGRHIVTGGEDGKVGMMFEGALGLSIAFMFVSCRCHFECREFSSFVFSGGSWFGFLSCNYKMNVTD